MTFLDFDYSVMNISKRTKAIIWVVALSVLCGLIIWHIIHWYSTGMYIELFDWIGESRAYLTVLYNLGSVILLSVTLGLLMGKITDLLGYEYHDTDHPDNEDKVGPGL